MTTGAHVLTRNIGRDRAGYDATLSTRDGRTQSHDARSDATVRPHLLRRLRYFAEHTGWDELIVAQDDWVDAFCTGVIIIASLYFVPPILVILFFR